MSWGKFPPWIHQGHLQIHKIVIWLKYLLNSILQGISDMVNNVHYWWFSCPKVVSKIRRFLFEPLSSNSRRVEGVVFSTKYCTCPPECTIDMNGCRWLTRIFTYSVANRVVFLHIIGPVSSHLHTTHTTTEDPPAWTVPCWHVGSLDLQDFLHTRARPSARYNWKRDSRNMTTCFLSSTVQWRCSHAQSTTVHEWACGSKRSSQWWCLKYHLNEEFASWSLLITQH